jgi:hypothetical protein
MGKSSSSIALPSTLVKAIVHTIVSPRHWRSMREARGWSHQRQAEYALEGQRAAVLVPRHPGTSGLYEPQGPTTLLVEAACKPQLLLAACYNELRYQ